MVEKETEQEIKMVAAVTETLKIKKANKSLSQEEILKEITHLVKQEKDEKTQMAMIAASSKALDISEKFHFLSDKEIIKQIVSDIKEISNNVD